MHAQIHRIRIAGALALIASWSLIGPGQFPSTMAASDSATITVHAFWCDVTAEDHLFPECHSWEWNALDNAEFTVAGATRFTRNGYVTWSPGAGEQTIQGANLIRYSGVTVVCTNQVTAMILHADEAEEDRVTITTTAGQETICDWYYHYER